jgi:NAD(P)-dependent dehydrogenase (short-subunit alcohol dehydrogenase family)
MDQVALITGGSRGLGAALALFLGGRGDRVIVTARDADRLTALARELAGRGARVTAIAGDLTDAQHRDAIAHEVRDHGRLDLLVNNASELGPSPLSSLVEYPLAALERLFAANVIAPLALVQSLSTVLERSRGLVVNITSDAARGGYPGWGGYGASEAALELVSLTLAGELRARGIGVVTVDPGDMRTDMHQAAYPGQDISDRPLPEVTLPFWAWLLGQDPRAVTGRRFEAQGERWEAAA